MIKVLKVMLGIAVAVGGVWEGLNIATGDAIQKKLNAWSEVKEVNDDDIDECSDEDCEE